MKLKEVLKFIVVSIVILGMLLTYGLSGIVGGNQTDTSATSFDGPTGEPYVNGPTTPPPTGN